jgi:hypothetical protein
MRTHKYKGKCEFCGKDGEVWRGFKEGKWHWACKTCMKKERLLTFEDICEGASIL